MLARETVKRRLEGDGISYTEFSYMLLQAADYLELSSATAAPFKWVAPINGATSSPASNSSAGCTGTRSTR